MRRPDKLAVALVTALAALAVGAGYAALHFGWFRSPWELAGWLAAGLAFIAVGLGLQAGHKPRNANVHGDARPASESEAQASARGEKQLPSLHDRTFPD